MAASKLIAVFFGEKGQFRTLFFVSFLLIFTFLGSREIWTQEHRWADIVAGMFYRQDFLHPYLGIHQYYDKPLLSYWFIVIISKLMGGLSTFSLRLPSALAGLLSIYSIYQIGLTLKDKKLGLLSGWLLLSTFYFIFWSRVSSADMLNLAGSLFAISWYLRHRDEPRFFAYVVFFVILSLTSLCKGLVGAMIPLIAVGVDVLLYQRFFHLNWRMIVAIFPAAILFVAPFVASSYSGEPFSADGLYLVYKENILRYFQPFDHRGPIYTYFLYLPIYLLPATLLLFLLACGSFFRWPRNLTKHSYFILFTLLAIFLFFTLSGSRRSYYVIPIVPFAILFTADWILRTKNNFLDQLTAYIIFLSILFLFLFADLLPSLYYKNYGIQNFAATLQSEVGKLPPKKRDIILLDAEAKLQFYLKLPPDTKNLSLAGERSEQTRASLLKAWPLLSTLPADTIFITRKCFAQHLAGFFPEFNMIEIKQPGFLALLSKEKDAPIAYVPKQ